MTFNAPLLFETAILMLAAFLAGAVIGLVLRLLLARPKPAVAVAGPVEAKPEAAAAPQLVKAPEIAPLPAARPALPAGQEMPAIKMPEVALPVMPAIASMLPSRVAGETVSGRHIDNPEHPHAASIEDVRAELVAQIDAPVAEPAAPTTAPVADAEIVPAALAEPEPALLSADDALAAEDAVPMLAEVPDDEAEQELPTEARVEPAIEAAPVDLTDAPAEIAAEIQDVIEVPAGEPVPEVVAETPLVEPVYERQEEEAAEAPTAVTEAPQTTVEEPAAPVEATKAAASPAQTQPAEPAQPRPVDDEMAAMRAIEGGWSPRRTATTRQPADLPEGVSAAEVAAAEQAVANSGAAVANVTALANAVLEEIAPKPVRPAGGFGRPASLAAPRDGQKDDFGQIKGIGPAVESALNGLGIYHFDQIAEWDQKAVVWIENHFGFKGRIARERWQDQARGLTRGRAPVSRPVRR